MQSTSPRRWSHRGTDGRCSGWKWHSIWSPGDKTITDDDDDDGDDDDDDGGDDGLMMMMVVAAMMMMMMVMTVMMMFLVVIMMMMVTMMMVMMMVVIMMMIVMMMMVVMTTTMMMIATMMLTIKLSNDYDGDDKNLLHRWKPTITHIILREFLSNRLTEYSGSHDNDSTVVMWYVHCT